MALVRSSYQTPFGEMPNVMVIHAGLECGLFKSAYPDWDMVSFGPTIRGAHAPGREGAHPGGRAFLATAGPRAGTYPRQVKQPRHLDNKDAPRPCGHLFTSLPACQFCPAFALPTATRA